MNDDYLWDRSGPPDLEVARWNGRSRPCATVTAAPAPAHLRMGRWPPPSRRWPPQAAWQ